MVDSLQYPQGLPGKNTLAHYKHFYITAVKSFITLGPGVAFNPGEIVALASGGTDRLGVSEFVDDEGLRIFISAVEKVQSGRARHLKNAVFCLIGDRKG